MADPRKASTNRIGAEPEANETFKYDGSIVFDAAQPNGSTAFGKAVRLTGNGTVGLTIDASPVHGLLKQVVWDGFCRVKMEGFQAMQAGEAATLTAGSKIVGAAWPTAQGGGGGGIRNVAAATLAEVAVARHTVIDATTATAVEVRLDG